MGKQKDDIFAYDDEGWRILGDFTKYAISDHGRVLNLKTGQFLTGTTTKYGYVRVQLLQNSVKRYGYIHRMVPEFFMEGYDPCYGIEHANLDRTDNRIENLIQTDERRRPSVTFL